MAGEMLPALEPGCLPLLDVPLLPTRHVLGIPLLLRSDIAGLASASAVLKQLGLTSPGLAGAFVAVSAASNGGKVSIRMLAEDGTGVFPSITVCDTASPSGVATIDLSSVLDSDLNEQQWREAEADYCSWLLDGQAEAMCLREVAVAFSRLVCLNRCWGQLRHAAEQASAPKGGGPSAAEHTPDGSPPPVPAVIDAPVLRQQLLHALQRPAFNDCELLGWLGRVVPWNEAAARRLAHRPAAKAAAAAAAAAAAPEQLQVLQQPTPLPDAVLEASSYDTEQHVQGTPAQQAQPTRPSQQQQRFMLRKVTTGDPRPAGGRASALEDGAAAQPAVPITPAANGGTGQQQTAATTSNCEDNGAAATAAGAVNTVPAAAGRPEPPLPVPTTTVSAGGGEAGAEAAEHDVPAQQQRSHERRMSATPCLGTPAGAGSRTSRSRSRSPSRPRSRSRSPPLSRSLSARRSPQRSRSSSHPLSLPGSEWERAAHARSPTVTGKGIGDGKGGAEGAGGAAPVAGAMPAAAPAAGSRQEAMAKGFAATEDTALEREQPLPAAPPQELGLPRRAARTRIEWPRDPRADVRMLPSKTTAAAHSAAVAACPVAGPAAAGPGIAGDAAGQTAAVKAAASEVPPQTQALSGAGGQAQLSRQSSELSEGELPRINRARRSSGQPAEDNAAPSTRPAAEEPLRNQRPSSRHHHSPADRGRGRSPARGRDRSRSRSNQRRSRSPSRYQQWQSRSWTPPRGAALQEVQSEQLAWARQLHEWLLRQPGHTATILQALSAGLGVPSRVLEATRRKACLFWDDHPQLWECRRHKHTFRPSELRALMPCGAGTGGTGPAAGRQQPASGGETSAPGSEQELARVEARYVRELHAFLLNHPQGIAVRDLPSYNMDVPRGVLRNRKMSALLKYYQSLGILRINNNQRPGVLEMLTVWAMPGRQAEAALVELFERLTRPGGRQRQGGGGSGDR